MDEKQLGATAHSWISPLPTPCSSTFTDCFSELKKKTTWVWRYDSSFDCIAHSALFQLPVKPLQEITIQTTPKVHTHPILNIKHISLSHTSLTSRACWLGSRSFRSFGQENPILKGHSLRLKCCNLHRSRRTKLGELG